MEFLEEESRPRFQLQSRAPSLSQQRPHEINKTQAAICIIIASLLFCASFFLLSYPIIHLFILWFSLSLFLGPFAPISSTGGDVRVGIGEELPQVPDPPPPSEPTKIRRSKPRKPDDFPSNLNSSFAQTRSSNEPEEKKKTTNAEDDVVKEEEWIKEDFQLLKKQIAKHPPGEPMRWALIAEAFNGRHGVDSVIKTAKSMSEKNFGGGEDDSFAQFLRQRKPLKIESGNDNGESDAKKESASLVWGSGEDIALLNALKAFPKDANLRWEKIAAAVPGKSKAACMKRFAELKKDFRSSKAEPES